MNDLRLWTFEELMALQAGSGAGAGGFATAAEQIPFGAGCLTSAEEQGNGSTSVEEQACIIIPFPRHEPLPPDIVNRPWLGRYIGPNTKIHRNVYATDAFRNGGPGGAPTPKPSYVFNLKSSAALEHLMTLKQWVVWDFVWKNGRWTKVPQNVYGGAEKYKWGEQKYWGSYTDAIETRGRGRGHDGIGYIIGPDDDITGIDLDHCLDPASGELEPWAQEIVDCNETYCEISPSGAGLRFFAKGKIDRTRKCNEAGTEVYRSGRFLTVTGNPLPGAPTAIGEAPKTIAAALARVEQFKPTPPPYVKPPPSPPREARDPDEEASFFRKVNDAAFDDIMAWGPELFPGGKWNGVTWRIPSKALGRNLQEDISIHPDGCKDWGLHDMDDERNGNRTPIDLVIEWRGQEDDALTAALWLCEQMKINPVHFGYYSDEPSPNRFDCDVDDAWLEAEMSTTNDDKPDGVEFPDELQPVDIDTLNIGEVLRETIRTGVYHNKLIKQPDHVAGQVTTDLMICGISADNILSIMLDDRYGISKHWKKDRTYIEERIKSAFRGWDNTNDAGARTESKTDVPPPPKGRRKNYEEFCSSYKPPVNIVGGIIQQGYFHFLTARSFHGKTLTAVSMMHAVPTGMKNILGIEIEQQGRVGYVMIENPDDTKKRVIAQRHHYGLNGAELRNQITIIDEFTYVDRRGKPMSPLDGAYKELQDDCKKKGPLSIVFIDSRQASFTGEGFNENVDMLRHAHKCRTFTKLPGNPAVIVLAHPVKNATEDNLVPYGGNAAFNECDCNLTQWKDEKTGILKLHWFGKFRGAPFSPILFSIKQIQCPDLVDSKGRPLDLPVLEPADAGLEENREQMRRKRQECLLMVLLEHPAASYREIEEMVGVPIASVKRLFVSLEKLKLVEKTLDGPGYRLTKKGRFDATGIKTKPF